MGKTMGQSLTILSRDERMDAKLYMGEVAEAGSRSFSALCQGFLVCCVCKE